MMNYLGVRDHVKVSSSVEGHDGNEDGGDGGDALHYRARSLQCLKQQRKPKLREHALRCPL